MPDAAPTRPAAETNRAFYEKLWRQTELVDPSAYNTWPLVEALCAESPGRLEVGPGLRPRLPVAGTRFVDLSETACEALRQGGGEAQVASVLDVEFADGSLDLIAAFDVVEHIDEEHEVMGRFSRWLRGGGTLLLAVPLHESAWTGFDDLVGHVRRYDPQAMIELCRTHGFTIERSATYGMQPRSKLLSNFTAWMLRHRFEYAMGYYNRHIFPYALRKQKPLAFTDGLNPGPRCDEVLAVCRRTD